MDIPQQAITYIGNFIKKLIPKDKVTPPSALGINLKYYFWINVEDKDYCVDFNMTLLGDFEAAINNHSVIK